MKLSSISLSLRVKLAPLIAALVCAAASLRAQEHPAMTAQPNTIFVGADGRYEANPDTAVIQFAISTEDNNSSKAYARAAKAADELRQVLRANGLEPKLAEIGYFAFQPLYEYRSAGKRKLVGDRVTANVVLKLKQFEKIGPILDALANSEISQNEQLSYTLEDKDAAKSKAVEDAYRRARASAESLAHTSGRSVGDLIYASVDTFEGIFPVRPLAMAAQRVAEAAPAPTAEFSPQAIAITAHVNAVFQLK